MVDEGFEAVPDDGYAELAAFLEQLGTTLSRSERWQECEAALSEAWELRERAVARDPTEANRYYLAAGCLQLALARSTAGMVAEALLPAQRGIEINRQLAEIDPDVHVETMLTMLGLYVPLFAAAGRPDGAVEPMRQAVWVLRRLDGGAPDRYQENLARALTDLARLLTEIGRADEALPHAAEAMELVERLIVKAPETVGVDLAHVLLARVLVLREAGRPGEAQLAADRAVSLYRALAEQDPDLHEPGLVKALLALSDLAESTAPSAEAVARSRSLVARHGKQHELLLSQALLAHGSITVSDSLLREAAVLSGRLSDRFAHAPLERPDAAPDLGRELFEALGDDLSLASAMESAQVLRSLTGPDPDENTMSLASVLDDVGRALARQERLDEAADAFHESLELRRQLAADRHPLHEAHLARSLHETALVELRRDHADTALTLLAEETEINRRWAELRPETFRLRLARSLTETGNALASLDRLPEACTAGQEAVDLLTSLAAGDRSLLEALHQAERDLYQRYFAAGNYAMAMKATRYEPGPVTSKLFEAAGAVIEFLGRRRKRAV